MSFWLVRGPTDEACHNVGQGETRAVPASDHHNVYLCVWVLWKHSALTGGNTLSLEHTNHKKGSYLEGKHTTLMRLEISYDPH